MIELKNINKIFVRNGQPQHILKHINLHVKKGEIFGIIGKSGAGKSTLLRCINLLEKPNTGEVIVNASNLMTLSANHLRIARQKIGMIFQHHNLLSCRTVLENVLLPLEIVGVPSKKRLAIAEELLQLTDIYEQKNHYPHQLSGGQKQRVAIARALTTEPHVLLCDEATASLDVDSTKSILFLLKQINQKLGLTIVLITHEIEVVKQICDRVGVISQGELVEVDSTLNVLTSPQTDAAKLLLSNIVLPKYAKHAEGTSMVVKLMFYGNASDSHFLSDIAKKFAVDINIQQAQIEKIQNTTVGYTLCEFMAEQDVLKTVLEFINNSPVKAEVFSHA